MTSAVIRPAGGFLMLALLLIGSIVLLLVSAAAYGAITSAVGAIYMGQPTTIGGAYGAMKGKIARTAGVWFVTSLLVGLGLLLFIVPGLLLALRWALVLPCTVLEETGVAESRTRSTTLTEGCRGRIFLIVLLYLVILYVLSTLGVVPLMVGIAIEAARTHSQELPVWYVPAVSVVNFFVASLVSPILMIALTLQYFDGRIRKEALDLQLMMSAAAGGGAAPAAAPTA
jgi:hypothetical protein